MFHIVKEMAYVEIASTTNNQNHMLKMAGKSLSYFEAKFLGFFKVEKGRSINHLRK